MKNLFHDARGKSGIRVSGAVPYKIISGPDRDSGAYPLTATYRGIVSTSSSITFDCPPARANAGINCSTNEAIAVDYQADGQTKTAKFAISLPYDEIDWPNTGTQISVEFVTKETVQGTRNIAFLELQENGAQSPFLGLGRNIGESNKDFSRAHGAFQVGMPDGYNDRDTAVCLYRDPCPRIIRLEPLIVDAANDVRVGVGTAKSFTLAGTSYKFWHGASIRRNGSFAEGAVCADYWPTSAKYGFARMK